MSAIDPCPFCDSTKIGAIEIDDDDWMICCNSCGGSGPTRDESGQSLSSAIEAWNRRTTTTETAHECAH